MQRSKTTDTRRCRISLCVCVCVCVVQAINTQQLTTELTVLTNDHFHLTTDIRTRDNKRVRSLIPHYPHFLLSAGACRRHQSIAGTPATAAINQRFLPAPVLSSKPLLLSINVTDRWQTRDVWRTLLHILSGNSQQGTWYMWHDSGVGSKVRPCRRTVHGFICHNHPIGKNLYINTVLWQVANVI